MLRFIKHNMETITGIGIYPMISFMIFFAFFIAVTYWVVKADKTYISELENLPLDDNDKK